MKIFRVTVRGQFEGLDAERRAALLADADDHEPLAAAFTEAGTFTYDRQLHSFSYRFQLRATEDALDAARAAVEAEALRTVEAHLDELGLGRKHLRASAYDMADVWKD